MREQATISEREQKVLGIIETARGKRAKSRDRQITMAHGAGGKATQSLIEGLFVPVLGGETLGRLDDAGAVGVDGAQLAITTDSYVVRPLRFPGGSIGELAVNGTVNDLAVAGARPLALALSLVLEEGLAAISVPVRSPAGVVVAVIGISGPTFRLGRTRRRDLLPALQAAAAEIERELPRQQLYVS